jgi:hypothetical protein
VFNLKNNIVNTSAAVMSRNVYLPFPVVADQIRITVSTGKSTRKRE